MDYNEEVARIVKGMTSGEKIGQLMDNAPEIRRLNIPSYNWWNEALHGVARSGIATSFPQSIGLAATFNDKLVHTVATAVSDEARAKYNEFQKRGDNGRYKGLTVWSPNINIFRDPRWGRGHETYGEDPYLTAKMGIAYVTGLQGDENEPYRKCDATIKHYAVHSGPESTRSSFDSKVNAKDLFETYLFAFEKCVRAAKPAAVMSAYNAVNGVPASCNEYLLQDVLRERFGFDGYVVSDCGAICNISEEHKYRKTKQEGAAEALKSGCDLNCGAAYSALTVALMNGLITETDIDEALVRLFSARLRLGMPLGGVSRAETPYDDIPYSVVECAAHKELALNAAEEGLVLLKNDGVLPLASPLNIAVIGCNANETEVFLANYNGTPSYVSTVPQAVAAYNRGLTRYSLGSTHTGLSETSTLEDAVVLSENSDVVLYCTGLTPRMEGEAGDGYNSEAGGDKLSLALPKVQYKLFDALVKTGKPVIVLNVSGSCVLLNTFAEKASAVLQCFYPGQMAADAVARVLFGLVSPTGRLPVTFYGADADLPPFDDYAMTGRTYRYFSGRALYPFGYGLTYTAFCYDSFTLKDGTLSFRLTNTGKFDAKETWQLYIRSDEPNQPILSLKAFGKPFVKSGESVWVRVPLTPEMFELTGEDGETFVSSAAYTAMIGSSSSDIKASMPVAPNEENKKEYAPYSATLRSAATE